MRRLCKLPASLVPVVATVFLLAATCGCRSGAGGWSASAWNPANWIPSSSASPQPNQFGEAPPAVSYPQKPSQSATPNMVSQTDPGYPSTGAAAGAPESDYPGATASYTTTAGGDSYGSEAPPSPYGSGAESSPGPGQGPQDSMAPQQGYYSTDGSADYGNGYHYSGSHDRSAQTNSPATYNNPYAAGGIGTAAHDTPSSGDQRTTGPTAPGNQAAAAPRGSSAADESIYDPYGGRSRYSGGRQYGSSTGDSGNYRYGSSTAPSYGGYTPANPNPAVASRYGTGQGQPSNGKAGSDGRGGGTSPYSANPGYRSGATSSNLGTTETPAGSSSYNPGATDYRPGQTDYRPGQMSSPPSSSDYQPGATGYRPGTSDYRPGNSDYQPPGAPESYELPASGYSPPPSYQSPASGPSPSRPGEFRPGSTSRYQPNRTSAIAPADPAENATPSSPASVSDPQVQPVTYTATSDTGSTPGYR